MPPKSSQQKKKLKIDELINLIIDNKTILLPYFSLNLIDMIILPGIAKIILMDREIWENIKSYSVKDANVYSAFNVVKIGGNYSKIGTVCILEEKKLRGMNFNLDS